MNARNLQPVDSHLPMQEIRGTPFEQYAVYRRGKGRLFYHDAGEQQRPPQSSLHAVNRDGRTGACETQADEFSGSKPTGESDPQHTGYDHPERAERADHDQKHSADSHRSGPIEKCR